MTRIELHYRLHLLTPMHIGSGMGFANIVDDLLVRAGPAKGDRVRLPYLPGSAIKGKVRSRCEALAHALGFEQDAPLDKGRRRVCGEHRCKLRLCILCRLFGSPYSAGHLHFSDALLTEEWQIMGTRLGRDSETNPGLTDPFVLATVRVGNKIERAVRTVEPDFLFSLEHTADDLQTEGSIVGQIDPYPASGVDLPLPVEGWLLVAGLQAVDKIGGMRSRGLGRCRTAVTSLRVDGADLTADLSNLMAREDYLLGLDGYEA